MIDEVVKSLLSNAAANVAIAALIFMVLILWSLLRDQMNVNKEVSKTISELGKIITDFRIEVASKGVRK